MMRSDPYSYMWVPTYQYYVDGDQTEPLETKGHIGNGKKYLRKDMNWIYITIQSSRKKYMFQKKEQTIW